jgi:hypothetical protein
MEGCESIGCGDFCVGGENGARDLQCDDGAPLQGVLYARRGKQEGRWSINGAGGGSLVALERCSKEET